MCVEKVHVKHSSVNLNSLMDGEKRLKVGLYYSLKDNSVYYASAYVR